VAQRANTDRALISETAPAIYETPGDCKGHLSSPKSAKLVSASLLLPLIAKKHPRIELQTAGAIGAGVINI
jgi:hypothetical protein